MLKETSYDGDIWPNPRHKLHRRAFRWPALRAVGELPRSNRIRLKDQIKPMLFWRIVLAQRLPSGTSGKGGSNATWECGSGRAAVVPRTRHSGRTLQVHPVVDRGWVLLEAIYPFGPHKTTYGAAWLRQLPSRGTNLCWAPSSFRSWGRGRPWCHFIASSVHLLRNIPPLRL